MGCCSQPKQPDPNPGLLASAQASERVAQEQIGLAREQFAWAKEQAGEDREFIRPFLEQQTRIADSNEARAADYANYEKQTFRPLEMGIVEDAQAFDTEGTRERLGREAAADVESQLGIAKASTARDIARAGGNAASGNFTDAFAKMNTQGALSKAQAQTNARQQATAMGHAMKMDASQLGRNLAGNASTAYGIALNANQGAQGGQLAQTGMANSTRMGGIGAYGQAQQGLGQANQAYGNEYGLKLQGYGTAMQGYGAMMGAVGAVAGAGASAMKFAGGGEVDKNAERVKRASIGGKHTMYSGPKAGPVAGPGTGISDEIDAKLSDGEYVIPADVVQKLGTQHFDKIVAKYHVPADVQRQMGVE